MANREARAKCVRFLIYISSNIFIPLNSIQDMMKRFLLLNKLLNILRNAPFVIGWLKFGISLQVQCQYLHKDNYHQLSSISFPLEMRTTQYFTISHVRWVFLEIPTCLIYRSY